MPRRPLERSWSRPVRARAKITRTRPDRRHHLGEPVGGPTPGAWSRGEIAASENMALATIAPAHAAERLERAGRRRHPSTRDLRIAIDERDNRIEVPTRDRAEHQDDGEETRGRGRCILKSCSPTLPEERFCAAIPEPMTMAARNPLPKNSARSRLHKGGLVHTLLSLLSSPLQQQDDAPSRTASTSSPEVTTGGRRRRYRSWPVRRRARCRTPMGHRRDH